MIDDMSENDGETAAPQPMPKPVKDDPIAVFILEAVASGEDVQPRDVAIRIAEVRARPIDPPDLWRKYLMAVNQQAKHLARQGRLHIIRKGEVADPDDVKGLFKLRRPTR